MMLPLFIIWPTPTPLVLLVMLPPFFWRRRRGLSMSMMVPALSAPTSVFPLSMWVHRLWWERVDCGHLGNCLLTFNDLLGCSFKCLATMSIPELGDRLREVTVDSPLIYQHVIHTSIGFYASLLRFILDKSVLQRISWFPVSNDLTGSNNSKSRKDKFQIMRLSHWIQFTYE